MNRSFMAIPVILCIATACAQTMPTGTASKSARPEADVATKSLDAGRALYARQEYALAIEKFNEAVRQAPDRPEGYNGLAASYDMIGRFDVSRIYYERALARAPSDGRVYRNMARSLRMQGREGEALAVLAEWNAVASDKVAVAAVEPVAPVAAAAPAVELAVQDVPAPVAAVAQPAPAIPAPLVAAQPLVVETSSVVVSAPMRQAAQSRTSVTVAIPAALPVVPKPAAAAIQPQARALAAIGIMNGAGKRGLARGVQTWLAKAGWPKSSVGDLDRRLERSYIVYPQSARSEAHVLSRQLPFTTSRYASDQASRIVLVLGRNSTGLDLKRTPVRPRA